MVQDFYNLVDVYLDAVLYPNCVRDEQTFQQEGWHYELDKPEEDITFKGEGQGDAVLLHGITAKIKEQRFRTGFCSPICIPPGSPA